MLLAAGCGVGGGEKNLFDIAKFLRLKQVEVFVVVPGEGSLEKELKAIGCSVKIIAFPKVLSLSSLLRLRAYLLSVQPQLVHAHGALPALYGRIANHYAGRQPFIYTIHGAHYLHYSSMIKKFIYIMGERMLVPWTSEFICVCQSDRQSCERARTIDPARTTVIYNGLEPVDPSIFEDSRSRLRSEFNIDSDTGTVLHIARFHYQKGQEFLIQAIPKVIESCDDVRFILVGDGPDFERIKSLSDSYGLSDDKVLFTGTRTDSLELMSASDVFVLSSRWEGLPYTIIEAMMMEKPVVATNVDGIPEAVEDGATGLLVPPQDPSALTAALIESLGDKDASASMGKQGRAVFEERFLLDDMLAKMLAIYDKLLDL